MLLTIVISPGVVNRARPIGVVPGPDALPLVGDAMILSPFPVHCFPLLNGVDDFREPFAYLP
ncbi:hypothetical protein JHW15_001637 [Salmonella enterica subsp. enterica]|nr:hypothetical protein [Salmonella enterica subsp. enterica]EHH4742664.1 hypothetical protein [Salmonella enterica subsp. enterica]